MMLYLGLGIRTGYPVGPVTMASPSPGPGEVMEVYSPRPEVVVVRLISVPGGRDSRRTLEIKQG